VIVAFVILILIFKLDLGVKNNHPAKCQVRCHFGQKDTHTELIVLLRPLVFGKYSDTTRVPSQCQDSTEAEILNPSLLRKLKRPRRN